MENFRRQFTLDSIETLNNLSKDLQSGNRLSGSRKRDAFRVLHTIKGTAQTFGFENSGILAHELENILSADEISEKKFLEAIKLLIKSLTEKDFEIPKEFAEKIHAVTLNAAKTSDGLNNYSSVIPDEIFSQLSNQEKTMLRSVVSEGKSLFCLEVAFELNDFTDRLINFRKILSASGEIIATFPSAKFNDSGKIGFQILLASSAQLPPIEEFGANLIFQSPQGNSAEDINPVLSHVVNHGKAVAKKLGKQIKIETRTDKTNLSPQKLKAVFDILLHLVRNAVDHAIAEKGEIKIDLSAVENGLQLIITDDGRGIDLEEIQAKAVEKNLISGDKVLTEQEAFNLIFAAEFSTKSDVTQISGRGIGLNAVKDTVEKNGGRINVKSTRGQGTTFEIFLPQ